VRPLMVYLRLCRAGIHTGLAGAQDYPAIYIRFYEGTEYPEIPLKSENYFRNGR
jgi:hypothetical protein